MSFDLFVQSCITLKRLTDVFKKYDDDRDGYVDILSRSVSLFPQNDNKMTFGNLDMSPSVCKCRSFVIRGASHHSLPLICHSTWKDQAEC